MMADRAEQNETPRRQRLPRRFELVEMSVSIACQLMSQGRTAECSDELSRASIYLRALRGLDDRIAKKDCT